MPPLQSFLTESALRHGARPALSMEDRILTYAELDASANRVANSLIRLGVRSGDRVALWMPKSLEAIISIWGILKAGAAFVPVDPAAPISRLATIARDCEVRALVSETARAADHDGSKRREIERSEISAAQQHLEHARNYVRGGDSLIAPAFCDRGREGRHPRRHRIDSRARADPAEDLECGHRATEWSVTGDAVVG